MSSIEFGSDDIADVVLLRRDIHSNPELCFQEHRTSELICRALTQWGVEVHSGIARTGVVGVLRSGSGRRAIGLRADIDALPISESNRFAHASRYPGRMHACGHDGHIAILLAAAKYLSARRNFDGTVYFIFQPAEEGGGGAKEMIKEGLFERFPMEAVFGLHNWPGLEVGRIAVASGPVFASSNDFKIVLTGKGAHAAMPHLGIDPIPAACHLIQAFQSIVARNRPPLEAGVISVTLVRAGETTNVTPDSCEIQGTVRTFTTGLLDLIETRMREVTHGVCRALGTTSSFEFRRNYPPTINHPAETEFVRQVTRAAVGHDNVVEFEPTMGAEDFSYFLQHRPGCYFVIGNGEGTHRAAEHGQGPCTLHNSSYDFNDDLIPLGVRTWAALVRAWLSPSEGTIAATN